MLTVTIILSRDHIFLSEEHVLSSNGKVIAVFATYTPT